MYLWLLFFTDISCHKTCTSLTPCASLFLRLSPLPHPTIFRVQELECINSRSHTNVYVKIHLENMKSVTSDFENRDCMKFHMGQLGMPGSIMGPTGYVKSYLETNVYMISPYESKGYVKSHSENKRQAKSHVQEVHSRLRDAWSSTLKPSGARDQEVHKTLFWEQTVRKVLTWNERICEVNQSKVM